ncbi:hypothetical protein GCM10010992_23310 [Cloacibacterium rupense]|uniref:Starch-binding associating with outer membrane n=1 Tax=Cloacibacterium rupense TaxID=517423 RepID=A0ABQ2NLG0_9FLAO|nr:SusD/RagB family nutrient-binding outer membrane lipoprotein [Cloacibacterium rupense]GGP05797.1 hypothetical protein GCM10010992_23310 [Cloacibacterium rupense]
MKKLLSSIILGVLAFSLTSCERDITSLNIDPKHPQVLPSGTLFAMGQYQQFYYAYTGSVNHNNYRFFTQMWSETTYTDEVNYDLVTRNQPRNVFNRLYVYTINNYEQAKTNLASEGGDPSLKANKYASLEIAQIFAWEQAVDTFGDIPYTDALKASSGQFAPKYDDAKNIYVDLIKRLNNVLGNINLSKSGYDKEDLVYYGDMSKWTRLANSIRLRLAINLADTDPALAKTTAEAAVASGVLSSNADSYSFHFDGGTFTNPVFDDLVASGRYDFVPSQPVVDLMNSKSDPRRDVWFTKIGGVYKGGPFGPLAPYNSYSHISSHFTGADAPANLFSYVEVLFLKAEGVARGFNMGGATAADLFKAAQQASMDENGVPAADASAYIAAHPYDATNWKKSIGEEAWISLFDRGFAAWNFTRRLDYPVLTNPTNSRLTAVPKRMPYSDQEYVLNKTNVTAAATKIGGDKAETKLFWDKF